jgi:hypothetical protein
VCPFGTRYRRELAKRATNGGCIVRKRRERVKRDRAIGGDPLLDRLEESHRTPQDTRADTLNFVDSVKRDMMKGRSKRRV